MWRRLELDGHLVHAYRLAPGEPLVAMGYSNQLSGEERRGFLPEAARVRIRAAAAGLFADGSEGGPDAFWWAVNRPLRERAEEGGPTRFVFRLAGAGEAALWEEASEDALFEVEGLFREEATRDDRARESAAREEVARAGYRFEERPDGWLYQDRDLPELPRDTRRDPSSALALDVEIPREERDGVLVLRPWRMWTAEESWWRPEHDAALTPERRRLVCERLAAWLATRGRRAEVVEPLPNGASPLPLPRVNKATMKTLLEFVLANGCRLPETKPRNPNYTGSTDPMEVFRGAGSPRKWYQTQGGEENVHVEGPIPVDLVTQAFALPAGGADGTVTVTAEKIDAWGGDLWSATIWAGPSARASA